MKLRPKEAKSLARVTEKVAGLGFTHRRPSSRGGALGGSATLFPELRTCQAYTKGIRACNRASRQTSEAKSLKQSSGG